MKKRILFVYNDYLGLKRRAKYAKYMKRNGYEVIESFFMNKAKLNQLTRRTIKDASPTLVWFLNFSLVQNNPIAVEYCNEHKIPIVVYGTSEGIMSSYGYFLETYKKIDYLFVYHKGLYDYMKQQGLNAHYVLLGFHTDQYRKCRLSKDINVSFCGTAQTHLPPKEDKRAAYVSSLYDFGVEVYGISFTGRVKKGIPVHKYTTHKEQQKVYGHTLVNLDLPFSNSNKDFFKGLYHIRNRFFEIPATCNFLLTVRCPEFLDVYDEDTVGYYDDNIESLRENVARYIKDKQLTKKMAYKSYELVHQKHTFQHRFKEMFRIIEKE